MNSTLNITISSIIFFLFTHTIIAKETWFIDKELSTITFELPVLLMKNVKGKFTEIEGLIDIDIKEKKITKQYLA